MMLPHTLLSVLMIFGLNRWLNAEITKVSPKNHNADALSTPIMNGDACEALNVALNAPSNDCLRVEPCNYACSSDGFRQSVGSLVRDLSVSGRCGAVGCRVVAMAEQSRKDQPQSNADYHRTSHSQHGQLQPLIPLHECAHAKEA